MSFKFISLVFLVLLYFMTTISAQLNGDFVRRYSIYSHILTPNKSINTITYESYNNQPVIISRRVKQSLIEQPSISTQDIESSNSYTQAIEPSNVSAQNIVQDSGQDIEPVTVLVQDEDIPVFTDTTLPVIQPGSPD